MHFCPWGAVLGSIRKPPSFLFVSLIDFSTVACLDVRRPIELHNTREHVRSAPFLGQTALDPPGPDARISNGVTTVALGKL